MLDFVTDYRQSNFNIIFLLPIAGLLIGFVFDKWGQKISAGNNLIIENVLNPTEKIPLKMTPFIIFATIITHLFGGSAGREGTAVQMGASIADQFTNLFNFSKKNRKIVLILGMSAGFSSVFGTPFAGAIFGLEVSKLGKIKYNAIFPAFITAIFADYITKLAGGTHTHYTIGFIPEIDIKFTLLSILAGIFFGLASMCFSKSTRAIGKFAKNKISKPMLRPFLGGIIIIVLTLIFPTTKYLGLGVDTIVESFSVQQDFWVFAVKILFTAITLGFGFKGGEVTPLFFIGATMGSALSFFIDLPMGLLAGMGFVAVFAGASNTPLACSIMAIELFGAGCAPYVVIACVTAFLISGHTGIYSSQIIGTAKLPQDYSEKSYKN